MCVFLLRAAVVRLVYPQVACILYTRKDWSEKNSLVIASHSVFTCTVDHWAGSSCSSWHRSKAKDQWDDANKGDKGRLEDEWAF